MTKEQLITEQQLKIHQLEEENRNLLKCIRKLRMRMVCVGGPLNDNVLGYSEKQLAIFWKMDKEIQGVIDCIEIDV